LVEAVVHARRQWIDWLAWLRRYVFVISALVVFGVLFLAVAFEVGEPARRAQWIGFSFPAFFSVVLIVSGLLRKDFILFEYRGKGLRLPAWVARPVLVAGGLWLLYDAVSNLVAG
jgi:hypothetical protein